jgi:hypothetical protein
MMPKEFSCKTDYVRTEFDGQKAQNQKAYGASAEDRQQEAHKTHLRNSCCEDKQFERRWRWKHGRKHERPERVVVECGMELLETLGRHSLAEKFLTAGVADNINNDAAEGRSCRCHEHVQKKTAAVLVDVAGDYCVHRKPNEAAIEGGRSQHTPGSKRLEQRPEKDGIAGKDVFYGLQGLSLEVYVKAGLAGRIW